jgi:hypothetical protein
VNPCLYPEFPPSCPCRVHCAGPAKVYAFQSCLDIGINCSYCILGDQILTELVFGGFDACQPAATANPSYQRLASLHKDCTGVPPHDLRKTFATSLLSRGAAITDVQHLLGHASVKATETAYARVVKKLMRVVPQYSSARSVLSATRETSERKLVHAASRQT